MDIQDETKEMLLNELMELRQENTHLKELYEMELTLRNYSEEAMHESNIKLISALKGGNMAWWEMDVTTGNVTFDKHKVEMLGYPPENFKHYKDFTALVHPKDYKRIMNAMRGHLDGTLDKYETEYRILTNSGEYIWFYDYGSVVKRDANGSPQICTGFVFNISDRKETELNLLKITKALDSASDAIAIADSEGHHFYQNKALSNLFGYETAEETEVAGGGVARIKDPAIAKEMFDNILNGISWSGELEMITKSGRIFPAYERADAIKDKEGNIIGIIGIISDITERIEAEKILRRREQLFQTVLDNFPGVVFWKDRQSNYLGCNQSFASGAGLKSPSEIVGKNDFEMPWGSAEAINYLNDDRDVMECGKGRLHTIETQHQFDGEVIWLDTSKFPLRDSVGQVIGVIGVSNDISTIKAAEQKLFINNKELLFQNEEKEKRAAELFIANRELNLQNREKEIRADELIMANKELLYQNEEKENRAAELIIANKELGFQNVERARRAAELIIANKELAFQNREKEKRADELKMANKELLYQNREKENRAAELVIANKELDFQNEEKEKRADELIIANKELVFQNEEKEKRADELLIAMDKAQASDRLKTAFMNNISHEIRTPLNGILGVVPIIIQDDIQIKDKEELMEILKLSSNRLMKTIDNYIDLSLIITKNMVVNTKPVNISIILANAIEVFQESLKKNNLEIKMQFPDNPNDYIIYADGKILQKAVSELLDNSIKFTNTGSITIGFEFINSNIEIFVKDTGIGIEKDFQEKVFERFMQEDVSVTREKDGSGLGLSIAQGMIQLLGGKIRLESTKHIGTSVFLTLPNFKSTASSKPKNSTIAIKVES